MILCYFNRVNNFNIRFFDFWIDFSWRKTTMMGPRLRLWSSGDSGDSLGRPDCFWLEYREKQLNIRTETWFISWCRTEQTRCWMLPGDRTRLVQASHTPQQWRSSLSRSHDWRVRQEQEGCFSDAARPLERASESSRGGSGTERATI